MASSKKTEGIEPEIDPFLKSIQKAIMLAPERVQEWRENRNNPEYWKKFLYKLGETLPASSMPATISITKLQAQASSVEKGQLSGDQNIETAGINEKTTQKGMLSTKEEPQPEQFISF